MSSVSSVAPVRQALVIGVADYSTLPDRASSLRAPVNDAAHWVRVLRALAVPPERITVLTSPALRPEDLVPFGVSLEDARALSLGVADTGSVNAAAVDLRERVAVAEDHAQSVIVFAGHGGATPHAGAHGLLADYAGGGVRSGGGMVAREGVLHLRALHHAAAGPRGTASILSIVDVCREDGARLDGAAEPQGLVLLSTARAGGQASERRIDGAWRSQGSWALQVVLEQWPTVEDTSGRYVGITYERLARQADALMRVFAVDGVAQATEVVYGAAIAPRVAGERAFLHAGARAGRASPSPVPGVAHNLPGNCQILVQVTPSNGETETLCGLSSDGNLSHYAATDDLPALIALLRGTGHGSVSLRVTSAFAYESPHKHHWFSYSPRNAQELKRYPVDALGLRNPTMDGDATLYGGRIPAGADGDLSVPVLFAFGNTPEGGPELRWYVRVRSPDEVPASVIPDGRYTIALATGASFDPPTGHLPPLWYGWRLRFGQAA